MAKNKKKGQDKHERRREKALRQARSNSDDNDNDGDLSSLQTTSSTSATAAGTDTTPRASLASLPQELFDAIFLQLDQACLLTSAQRVCKVWFNLIQTSSSIQQHLFFFPILPTTCNYSHPKENPLMKHLLGPLCFQEFPIWNMHRKDSYYEPPRRVTVLDADLLSLQGSWKSTLSVLPMADMRDQRRLSEAFLREGASWRRMLPSQPPPGEILHFSNAWKMRIEPGDGWKYFKHRLKACELKSLEVKNGEPNEGDADGHEVVFRLGEIYDIVYYILWGRDIPYENATAASSGLLPAHALDMLIAENASSRTRGWKLGQCRSVSVQWALFTNLCCGRDKPDFVFRKQRQSAVHREYSRYWFHVARYGHFDHQRARQSSMGTFKCKDYDEEKTKKLLRLQSEKDRFGD